MTQNIWDIGVTIKVIYFDRTAQEIESRWGKTVEIQLVGGEIDKFQPIVVKINKF